MAGDGEFHVPNSNLNPDITKMLIYSSGIQQKPTLPRFLRPIFRSDDVNLRIIRVPIRVKLLFLTC